MYENGEDAVTEIDWWEEEQWEWEGEGKKAEVRGGSSGVVGTDRKRIG